MNDQNFARFETQLERLIEGAFAQIFSKTVRAQDIALQLARAMETMAEPSETSDPRPLAPDTYLIRLHVDVRDNLLARQPTLPHLLSQHMVELASEAGYRLTSVPVIEILADASLSTGDVMVDAQHTTRAHSATAVMERVDLPAPNDKPDNAQLIVNGSQVINLGDSVINIGRSRDNHIVLDDPYVSRHHAQIRLRFGRYTLFDVQSQSGAFVNDMRVREHPLQSGDVIRLGRAQIVYLDDDALGESQTSAHPRADR